MRTASLSSCIGLSPIKKNHKGQIRLQHGSGDCIEGFKASFFYFIIPSAKFLLIASPMPFPDPMLPIGIQFSSVERHYKLVFEHENAFCLSAYFGHNLLYICSHIQTNLLYHLSFIEGYLFYKIALTRLLSVSLMIGAKHPFLSFAALMVIMA